MITLPVSPNQEVAQFRLLTRESWGGAQSSGPGWVTQPMSRPRDKLYGYVLKNYTRSLLPQLGTANLVYRYGLIDGRLVGAGAVSATNLKQGNAWNPESDAMDLPDLRGKEIRIQSGYANSEGVVTSWRTVFWGTCEYQTEVAWGAATLPGGERQYTIVDAFHRTKRWLLDRHGFVHTGGSIAPAAGHPGYNYSRLAASVLAGNRDPNEGVWEPTTDGGVYAIKHTLPGAGTVWTDEQVINDACVIGRPSGQPHWILNGAVSLFGSASPWPVQPGMSLYELVTTISQRSRGRGAILPDWEEESSTGVLTCYLRVFAQLYDTVQYYDPVAEAQRTLNGASANETAIDIDLIGDHRYVDGSLVLGDAEQYQVDYLESIGEPIEVMGTLEHSATLEPGWAESEKTAFDALDPENRIDERWKPVYCLHRLKRGFKMLLGDGNGGDAASADYRCTDRGVIETVGGRAGDSAPTMLELLDDVPFFEGYEIAGGVARRADLQTAPAFNGTAGRRGPGLYFRTDDDLYKRIEQTDLGFQLHVLPDGLLLTISSDAKSGERRVGDTSVANLNSLYDYDQLVCTVGFRLPHPVRFATGDPLAARRKLIQHPNLFLLLVAPNAIWDLDGPSEDAGSYPAKRSGGAAPVIVRDDRATLALRHALSVAWYGPLPDLLGNNTVIHRSASFALKCGGDIPGASDYDGGSAVYPELGYVVRQLSACGQRFTLNTPVSAIAYNADDGVMTCTTDWQDLDFRHG